MTTPPQDSWRRIAVERWKSHWLLKAVGISGYITVFMMAYFALLEHPQFAVTRMPLQWLDHAVGFAPWAVLPYASLWLYIALVPAFLYLRGEMACYVASVTVLAVIGCGIFFFWPTAVPDFGIDWSRHAWIAGLKSVDTGGNAFPSLHVAYSVLTAIWLGWLMRRLRVPRLLHGLNVLWCLLIVWSTLATRQHVAWDVEAGALLGVLVAWFHVRWLERRAVSRSGTG